MVSTAQAHLLGMAKRRRRTRIKYVHSLQKQQLKYNGNGSLKREMQLQLGTLILLRTNDPVSSIDSDVHPALHAEPDGEADARHGHHFQEADAQARVEALPP